MGHLEPADDWPRVRVTLSDTVEGFSASVPSRAARALVAALATEPAAVEAHLRAADALYFGLSALIVGALIEHDRAELLHRRGLRPPPIPDSETEAWPIRDFDAFCLACRPASGGALWLDLADHAIRTLDLSFTLNLTGEIAVFDGRRDLARTVTYDLRGYWHIERLPLTVEEAPGFTQQLTAVMPRRTAP